MLFKGIIFDFNGVLLWDEPLQVQVWNALAMQIRGRAFSEEELATHLHGRTNQHVIEYLNGHAVDRKIVETLARDKEAIYQRMCLTEWQDFRLSPGAVALLDFLAARRIPRTIATASPKGNVEFFITHLSLSRWFLSEQIVYDDGLRPGKPAPDIYLQAAENLGLAPADCVVVEDARAGLQAALAAGIGYIVALGPAHTHAQLRQIEGVDDVIVSLEQLSREKLFSARVSNNPKLMGG
jgi:beta-phosphoglucomutase